VCIHVAQQLIVGDTVTAEYTPVTFQQVNVIFRDIKIGRDIMFINSFAEVVYSPVLTVKVNDHLLEGLSVNFQLVFSDSLNKSIAEHGILEIIS